MRADELPALTLGQAVQRLRRAFGTAKGLDEEGFVAELQRATRGWTERELEMAIDEVIRSDRTWPRIASILRARPSRAPREHAEGATDEQACHLCGQAPYCAAYETADGRLLTRTRCGCPPPGRGWDSPRAKAWNEEHRGAAA